MNLGTFTISRRPMHPQHRYLGFWNHGTWRHWHCGFTGRPIGIVTVQWLGRGWRPLSRTHDSSLKIDVADKSVELFIEYTFNHGSSDWFGGGCWNPGDPDEIEILKVEVIARDGDKEIYVKAQPWLHDIIGNSDLVFQHIGERHQRDDELADYELERS